MRASGHPRSGRDCLENKRDQSTEEAACPCEEEMRGRVEHQVTSGIIHSSPMQRGSWCFRNKNDSICLEERANQVDFIPSF